MTPRFEVTSFEQIAAGRDTVLLRISGRWHGPRRERLAPPLLLLDDGKRTHRLAPLPSPEDIAPQVSPDPRPWRAAYSAPASLASGPRVAFALEAGRGGIIDLPGVMSRKKQVAPPLLSAF